MSIEAKIKRSLSDSIAGLGYPVGMGLPPPDEALDKMTAAILAAIDGTHAVVERAMTDERLNLILGRPPQTPVTPMSWMFRDFFEKAIGPLTEDQR